MSVHCGQTYEYQGEDWWTWSIWVDGPEAELDQIDHVMYTLHPTFPHPVRTRRDRATKFRLDAEGWGVFPIHVRVRYKDGTETKLRYDLVLAYPDGTHTTA